MLHLVILYETDPGTPLLDNIVIGGGLNSDKEMRTYKLEL
jgi:hypothetical protein